MARVERKKLNMRKAKTMNLGKGGANIAYAKVPARVAEFHKDNKNGKIETSYEFKDAQLIFKATVTPDHEKPTRYFTGTSFGKVTNDKSLEKLETVAVGRALAFAGYLADGEIASAEEMEKHEDTVVVLDVSEAMAKLQAATTLVELAKVYRGLSADERNNEEVNTLKDELKKGFGGVTIGVTEKKDENV